MGVHGACVAGSRKLIEYLINFARPFIYTTALTPHSIAAIDCSFDYLNKNIHLQSDLTDNINDFLQEMSALPNRTASRSAIQTVIVPGNSNVRKAASGLQELGFDIRPIVSPTVPVGSERLRIASYLQYLDEIVKLQRNKKVVDVLSSVILPITEAQS